METFFQICLSNSLVALVLAVLATAVAAVGRRPALVHALWVLVLVKLVTPPLVSVSSSSATMRHLFVRARTAIAREAPARLPAEAPTSKRREYYTWRYWERPKSAAADDLAWAKHAGTNPRIREIVEQRALWVAKAAETVTIPSPHSAPISPRAAEGLLTRLGLLVKGVVTAVPRSSQAWALVLWMGIALLWWALTAARIRKFQRLLQSGTLASEELQEQTRSLAARLGVKRVPEVWLVPAAIPPMLWALAARPLLVVPSALLSRLDTDKRASLLVHELAHVKRRDHWIRLLEIAVTGLHWWNPLVWWSKKALREAEERCCDAWVVWALPGSARSYASTILDTADFLAEAPHLEPLAGTALTSATQLRRRLIEILSGTTGRHLSWTGTMTLFGLTLLVLAMGPVYPSRRFFRAMDLGSLGGGWTEPRMLNDRAQVVGQSHLIPFERGDVRTTHRAFRTAPGRPIDPINDELNGLLGLPSELSQDVFVMGINNAGQVVVDAIQPRDQRRPVFRDVHRGFRIDGRRAIELDPEACPRPIAINDAGQVAGVASRERVLTGAERPLTTPRDMKFYDEVGFRTPPNQPLVLARDQIGHFGEQKPRAANVMLHLVAIGGVNALGQVVGAGRAKAFRTAPNRPIDPASDDIGALAFPPETPEKTPFVAATAAFDVNDLGQVVGRSYIAERSARTNFRVDEVGTVYSADVREEWSYHAFRTAPNRPINPETDDLGSLGGPRSAAQGINNLGDVVGESETADGQTRAFLFSRGHMMDLNQYVTLEQGWILERANDINNRGQIIAVAYNTRDIERRWRRAYLLSPAPEPGALVMLILGTTVSGSGLALKFGQRVRAWLQFKFK